MICLVNITYSYGIFLYGYLTILINKYYTFKINAINDIIQYFALFTLTILF
jgi:hypothetical protein